MKKSAVYRDFMQMIIAVIVFVGVIYLFFILLVARNVRIEVIANQLQTQVDALVSLSEGYAKGDISQSVFLECCSNIINDDEAYSEICATNGERIYVHTTTHNEGLDNDYRNSFKDILLRGNSSHMQSVVINGSDMYCSCSPVLDSEGRVLFFVFSSVPANRTIESMNFVTQALALISIILFPLLLWYCHKEVSVMSHAIVGMIASIAKISKGDLDIETPAVRYYGEYLEFANALEKLVGDLREETKAETERKERLDMIIRSISDAIISVDRNVNVILQNKVAENLHIVKNGSIINDDITQALCRSMDDNAHVEFKYKKGDVIYLVTCDPCSNGVECAGAVLLLKDITETERNEELRNNFVSNLSHELRTPLTVIKGFAQNLEDYDKTLSEEKKTEYRHIIVSEVDRLARLVSDMMFLSKLRAGILKIETAPLDIKYCADSFTAYIKPILDTKNMTISSELPDSDVIGLFDYDRLRQLLVILSDNAIKHSPCGSRLKLWVSDMETVYNWLTDRKYVFSNAEFDLHRDFSKIIFIGIADEGEGISEENMPKIFDRFFTVDKSHKKSTGLGLALASEIMASIGETMIVSSEPGEGSCIGFTLALCENPDEYEENEDDM